MPHILASLDPHFYCQIRNSWLYQDENVEGTSKCVVVGAESHSGWAMGFLVLVEDGSLRATVPVSELVHKEDAPRIPLDLLQLWSNFGTEFTYTRIEYFKELRCRVVLKDKSWSYGTYVGTFAWTNSGYSEEPTQRKMGHLIALDNGCYTIQPGNRTQWFDASFVEPFDISSPPKYKVDQVKPLVERSDRWIKDEDSYYYGFDSKED